MGKVLIDEQYLHDIADSIRKMTGKKSPITTDSMAGEIEQAEIVWNPDEKWTRPLAWPDYSQIDLTNFEGMYFTYDTSSADHYDDWVGLYCACTGGYKVERGQIVNGSFVAEATSTQSSGATFEEWIESTITGYVVYRITPATSGQHITSIGLRNMSATLRTDGRYNRTQYFQPLVERYGRLPYLTTFSQWGNYFVNSDTILDLKSLTSHDSTWVACDNIQNINIAGYDSTVTTCSQMFNGCRRLRYLNETDKFVTSTCTSMYYMFNECNSLPFIDCGGWNTSNVTRMDALFSQCYNLYKADVSNWDVSKVTILSYMFNNCYKLKKINMSNWTVTLPTNYQQMFQNCTAVEELDVSGFTTTNVTNMYYTFYGCESLKELDVSHFNTANVTTFQGMFAYCRNLKHLDVSGFNTAKATNFASMFNTMINLESINISGFDTSLATTLNSFLSNSSFKMKSITLPTNFITNKITSNGLDNLFNSLVSVHEFDLSNYDMSGVTAPSATFRYCYQVEKIVLPTSLKYIGTYFFGDCRNLKTIVLPSTTVVFLNNTNAFTNTNRAKTIYVPDNLVSSYQTATNWKSLSNVTFAGLSTLTS